MLLRTPLAVSILPTLLACGNEPSPVVVGQVGPALTADASLAPTISASIDVEINGDGRLVPLGVEETFAIQTLPTGDLEVRAAIEGITGIMEVYDVQPGEVIEVGVEAAPGSLLMGIVRRDSPGDDYGIIHDIHGPLQIHSDHVVHHLEPGLYDGDIIITGDHVTVVGPDDYGCRRGGRAVLLGDLIIESDHVRVVNLEVQGQTLVFGDHNRIYQSCELFGWEHEE